MLHDAQLLFSDAQAVTAAAASTNIVDLGTERRIGTGEKLFLVVQVDTAFTDAGSDSTLAVILQSDADVAFGSAVTMATVGTFAALSAAGSRFIIAIPPSTINERYIRVYYTPANGNLTTGALTAFLVHDIDAFVGYPDNSTIT